MKSIDRFIRRRRGFTLTETLVSCAIIGVLLVAMGSAVTLSTQAIPSEDHAGHGRLAAARAIEQINADLAHALFVPERTATAVTVVVRDRTGDGTSERIRYAWSGNAGDPVTRQLNDAEARPILAGAQHFALSYTTEHRPRAYPAPITEDSTETRVSYKGSLLDLTEYQITQSDWLGQYIEPTYPADAISWRPTRALFHARRNSSGPLWVRVLSASSGNVPAGPLVAHGVADSANFDALLLGKHEIAFETAESLPPGQPVTLIFRNDGSTTSPAYIAWQLDSDRTRTTNGGASWSHSSLEGLPHELWGVFTRQGPPQQSGFTHLTTVAVDLTSVHDPQARVHSSVHLRNEPPLLNVAWEADFHQDIRTLDLIANGTGDWYIHETTSEPIFGFGGSTDTSGTIEFTGVWDAPAPIETRPLHDFNTLTRVDVRMRHAATGTYGAVFEIFADRSGDQAAELLLVLHKQSDGSQTLTLRNPGATDELLTEIPGLYAGFADLSLLIDPTYQTVHLMIDNRSHGTFPYQRRTVTTAESFAGLRGDVGAAEFDFVRIRVAE